MKFPYRSDIDGIRALAVLMVVFFHAGLGCPGGFVGVDVFFVVSGFLICRILEAEVQTRSFSYESFMERRLRRLMPALAVTLAFTTTLGWFVLSSEHYRELGATLAAQPLLSSNLVLWNFAQMGYFQDPPEIRPLLHTWSLAVEEQFYLLFPALLWVFFRWGNWASLTRLYLALVLLSSGLSWWTSQDFPKFAFFLLPTRVFELLLGALSARWVLRGPGRLREFLAWLGLAMVLASAWVIGEGQPFPGWLAWLPCLGTSLLLVTGQRHSTLPARLLSRPLLVGVGAISYSLYLWHWPLMAYWKYVGLPWDLGHRWALVGLSLVCGTLSWRWVERPVRRRRWLGTPRKIMLGAVAFSVLCYGVGFWIYFGEGLPQRWAGRVLPAPETPRIQRPIGATNAQLRLGLVPEFGDLRQPSARVALWGDSHAGALVAGLDRECQELHLKMRVFSAFSRPFFDYDFPPKSTRENQRERVEIVRELLTQDPPDLLILACYGSAYEPQRARQGLEDLAHWLKGKPWTTRVVLQVPFQVAEPRRALAESLYWGRDPDLIGILVADHELFSKPFQQLLRSTGFPPEMWIDPAPALKNPRGLYGIHEEGRSLYHDKNHLSEWGSEKVGPVFRELLVGLERP